MSVPGPVLGPCQSWIDGDYLSASGCCSALTGSDVDPVLLETVAFEASMALYEFSGRQFNGLCDRTVRPCTQYGSGCWPSVMPPVGNWWYWTWGTWGSAPGVGWAWRNESGPLCGCAPMSTVKLGGYPVREIVEVKIDGSVLDANDSNGNPNYRLDGWRDLVRMDDPVTGRKRLWPSCQNLSLDDTQAGTFSVSYRWGVDPPEIGRQAAAELACQLLQACPGGDEGECALPEGVTRVERQGITFDREILAGFFDPKKPTGLLALDIFLSAYAETPRKRIGAVFSPDVQQFARRAG